MGPPRPVVRRSRRKARVLVSHLQAWVQVVAITKKDYSRLLDYLEVITKYLLLAKLPVGIPTCPNTIFKLRQNGGFKSNGREGGGQ